MIATYPFKLFAFQEKIAFDIAYIHFPPLLIVDEPDKGPEQVKGLLKDFMTDLTAACDYDVTLNYLSLNRFYSAVAKGDLSQVQVVPKGIEAFKDVLIYNDLPVATTVLNLYWNQTSDKSQGYNLADLNNQSVVVIRGYQYAGLLNKLEQNKSIDIIAVDNIKSAKTLLMKNRAKFALMYESMFIENKMPNENFKSSTVSSVRYYLTVHKSLERAEEILKCLANVQLKTKPTLELEAKTIK